MARGQGRLNHMMMKPWGQGEDQSYRDRTEGLLPLNPEANSVHVRSPGHWGDGFIKFSKVFLQIILSLIPLPPPPARLSPSLSDLLALCPRGTTGPGLLFLWLLVGLGGGRPGQEQRGLPCCTGGL